MFSGFPPEALAFYEGLERDNSKAYWQAHRETYESCVREPIEDLVAELAHEFGAAKVFRPYRDVRFSRDKTPYKTGQAALAREDRHAAAGRYIEINARGLTLGAGVYHPDREQLARIRRAIDHDRRGPELVRIRDELAAEGLRYLDPDLRTAPRGYPRDHPRIDLLRNRRHAALVALPPGPWLHDRRALDRIADIWRRGTPLVAWIERAIA
jgi:uncharacterized protein (TIGR02453 family)